MLLLLHGENQVASRTYLDRFKKATVFEIYDGKNLNPENIQSLLQPSLLENEKTIVIENPKESHLSTLSDQKAVNLVVWYGKKLEKIALKPSAWQILEFKPLESKVLYKFLDSFISKNLKNSLTFLEYLKQENIPSELIVGALNKQIITLIYFRDDASSVNPFQRHKLAQNSPKWTEMELQATLKKLLETDYKIKSGKIIPEVALDHFVLTTICV